MKQEKLLVNGMKCNNCANSVIKVISQISGVDMLNVDLKEKNVFVDYDENLVSLKEIVDRIERLGYKVVQ